MSKQKTITTPAPADDPKTETAPAPETSAQELPPLSDEIKKKNPRARAWVLTQQEPEKYFNMPDATPEELVQHALDIWTKTKTGKLRDNRGAGVCYEIGNESEKPHLHIFLSCTTRDGCYWQTVYNSYPNAWIHFCTGTADQQKAYLDKSGKWADTEKAKQTVVPGMYQGVDLVDGKRPNGKTETTSNPYSRANTLKEADERLNAGATPADLYGESARFSSIKDAISTTFFSRLAKDVPPWRELTVIYHCGDPGSGKSMTRYRYENDPEQSICVPTSSGKNMFDDYNGEKVLFLDDYRGENMPWDMFLRVLDGYRLILPARYANKIAAWERVEITSTVPLELLYPKKTGAVLSYMKENATEEEIADIKATRYDNYEQLRRRISYVYYHYVDPLFEGDQRFQVVKMPARAYKNIEQVERLARDRIKQHKLCLTPPLFPAPGDNHLSYEEFVRKQEQEITAENELNSIPGLYALAMSELKDYYTAPDDAPDASMFDLDAPDLSALDYDDPDADDLPY